MTLIGDVRGERQAIEEQDSFVFFDLLRSLDAVLYQLRLFTVGNWFCGLKLCKYWTLKNLRALTGIKGRGMKLLYTSRKILQRQV